MQESHVVIKAFIILMKVIFVTFFPRLFFPTLFLQLKEWLYLMFWFRMSYIFIFPLIVPIAIWSPVGKKVLAVILSVKLKKYLIFVQMIIKDNYKKEE